MGQKIVEAIIEDGRLKYVAGDLPAGKIKVHLVYDLEEPPDGNEIGQILAETSGIYSRMDADREAKSLRNDWERKIDK
jgi:hypothetical protein